jgi:hypothetical protein
MTFDLPPIAKAAERLAVEIELAVRTFPRFHKYQLGADLRAQAFGIVKLINRAWRDRARQAEWTGKLVWAIDELRVTMQLCSRVQAFRSFRQFEMLIRLVESLGKQAGGWNRQQQLHRKGQNPAREAAPERAQILSTHAASTGANA